MTHSTTSPLPAADLAAISAARQHYVDAWLRGSPDEVMETLTPDAVLLPHHGLPPVVGAAAIRRFWWPDDAPPTTILEFAMDDDEVGGDGDLGYTWGRFRLTWQPGEGDGERSVTNQGTDMMLLRRCSDGRWRISHHMWDDPA